MSSRPRNKLGQFVSTNEDVFVLTHDLPTTNAGVVKLYQKFGILPKVGCNGVDLKLIDTNKKHGDSINDNLTFFAAGTSKYPSIRPILNNQSKLDLKQTNDILYEIALDISHKSICQTQGWVTISNGNTHVNNAPVTRLRRNLYQNFIFFFIVKNLSFKVF